ncbi:MAG: hypothetical protein B6U69_00075 [Thermofilum sp. ex4484_15]|nr:MAG: hypothetical protein B6U69_00075 [Thermofilum sp. ex4484_15]
MELREIAVIGAGPMALLLARELAYKGILPLLVEEHNEIGIPRHCSGLVSIKGLELLRVRKDDYIENEVRGARFYSPSSKLEVEIIKSKPLAYVIDRELFDKYLYSVVNSLGVNFVLNARVLSVHRFHNQWSLKLSNGKELRTNFLVNGEGARYRLVKYLGFEEPPEDVLLTALQYDVKGVKEVDDDIVEVYLGNRWAPKFFAWIIPRGEGRARVGLASVRKPVYLYLRAFMKHHPIASKKLAKAKFERLTGGKVVLCGPSNKVWGERSLLIGDAACCTKPTTGGGLIIGGLCTIMAARALINYLLNGRDYYEVISSYNSAYYRFLYGEIKYMKFLREFLASLNDRLLESAFKAIRETGLDREVSALGDMERHSIVVREALKKPPLLVKLIPHLLTWMVTYLAPGLKGSI